MTDLTQMIRWNANFVRGLAQTVLERAKVIRGSLKTESPSKRLNVKKAVKRTAKRPARKQKRTNA